MKEKHRKLLPFIQRWHTGYQSGNDGLRLLSLRQRMSNFMNIAIYFLLFAGGFVAHKFLFANRERPGWTNREFDSTLTLGGLFILVT